MVLARFVQNKQEAGPQNTFLVILNVVKDLIRTMRKERFFAREAQKDKLLCNK
jgi:hypothetical protein